MLRHEATYGTIAKTSQRAAKASLSPATSSPCAGGMYRKASQATTIGAGIVSHTVRMMKRLRVRRSMPYSIVPMRKFAVISAVLLGACGGGGNEVVETKNPPPPPPPTVSSTTATDGGGGAPPLKLSLADQEKLSLKTAVESLNAHDPNRFASVFAMDAQIRVSGANEINGRDAIATNMKEWFETFSQVKLGFSRVWIKDDTVVVEWVINGTHSGELFGVKGTQNQIGHYGLSIVTFDKEGGTGVKLERRYGDLGTVASQIGASKDKKTRPIPPLPQTTETIVPTGSADEAKNIDVVKTAFGALEKKDDKAFAAALDDNVEIDGFVHLDTVKGKAEGGKFLKTLTTAFPDLKIDVKNAWPIGDYAVVEYVLNGTHKGALGDVKATNRKVSFGGVDVIKVKAGKIARVWTYSSGIELMTQLGLYEPGAPPKDAVKPPPTPAKK